MFTGIIRHLGTIQNVRRDQSDYTFVIAADVAASLGEGDSIAVNGVCLTVLTATPTTWEVRLMQETLAKTNLGQLRVGSTVNLEQPLRADQRLDGHFVLGHVDGTCTVTDIVERGGDKVFTFAAPEALLPYLIPKGSVALDGVSLTIVDMLRDGFTVSYMPYTLTHTTFGTAAPGYLANIEVDVLGKYAARLLTSRVAAQYA